MTNRRNRAIYRLWAPVYDSVLARFFRPGRVRAMELLDAAHVGRVVLVGVGTGMDLPLLPTGARAVGIDLSPAMLARAEARLPLRGREIELQVADAQRLPFPDGAFDAGLLNLILSVVPDPAACLGEVLRVVRPGGRIVVFDKFVRDGQSAGIGRQLANRLTTLFGTDINRRFGDIARGLPCTVVSDEASIAGGMYRVLVLRRDER